MRLLRRTFRVYPPTAGAGAEPAPAAVGFVLVNGRATARTGPVVALPRAPGPRLDILAFKIAWIFRKFAICFARALVAIFALMRCFCTSRSQFSGEVFFALNVPFVSVRFPVPDISTSPG